MMCVTPWCCVRVCVGLSSYDSVCAPLAGSLWVTGRSGVCIPVMYALVYQLCACLSVSPCGARVCLWLGVSSWVSKGPPDPGLSSGVCGVCGHRKHLRGAWARYTRGPGSAVCCAGGRSLLCCISCHTHTHTPIQGGPCSLVVLRPLWPLQVPCFSVFLFCLCLILVI